MKQIPRFPDYSVTEAGQVWSHRSEKWLKPAKGSNGYFVVSLCMGKQYSYLVHRLVLETFVGPCPEDMECRHLDGDRTNNRLDNLCWGTRSENQYDCVQHGTNSFVGQFGEDSNVAKISNQDRRLIIYQYLTGLFTQAELGEIYGIAQTGISRLVRGHLWPFVDVKPIMRKTG